MSASDQTVESKRPAYDKTYSLWKSWDQSQFGVLFPFEERYFHQELKRARCQFSNDARVLEIGFGNGKFLAYARKRGWSVVGIEANGQLVNLAKQHRFDALHADNLSQFESDRFDLVVAFDVFEHVPKEELLGWFFEIHRILREGGRLVARFPNGDSPFGLLNQNGDVTHVTCIGGGMARYFAATAGMSVIYMGGEAHPIIGETPIHTLHNCLTLPIKKLIDLIIRLLFFPKTRVDFCVFNYTLICKK